MLLENFEHEKLCSSTYSLNAVDMKNIKINEKEKKYCDLSAYIPLNVVKS